MKFGGFDFLLSPQFLFKLLNVGGFGFGANELLEFLKPNFDATLGLYPHDSAPF